MHEDETDSVSFSLVGSFTSSPDGQAEAITAFATPLPPTHGALELIREQHPG